MKSSTISSKGQVTIPKKIREFLKVGTSDKIVFIPFEEGKVIITKKENNVSTLFGMFKHRSRGKPVSLKKMNEVIKKRRIERACK